METDKMNLLGVNSNNKKIIEKILEIKMTEDFRVSKTCVDEMIEKINLLLEILGINNINPILIFNILTSSFCDYTSNEHNSCVVDKSVDFYNFFYEHLSTYTKNTKALPMYFSKDRINDDFKYFIDRTLIGSSSLFSFDFKDKYDNDCSNEEYIYKMFYLLYDYLKNKEFFDEYYNCDILSKNDFSFTYSYNFLCKHIVEEFYQSAIENDGYVTDRIFSKYSNYIDVSKFSENVKSISNTIDVKNLKKWLEKNISIENKYKYEGKYEDLNDLLSMMYLKDEKKRIGEPQLVLFLQIVKSSLYYNEWYKYKQIFKVSNELEDDFINNENHTLPFVAIKNIPFNCFYIDMTDNETLGQYFNGAFVYINNLQYEKCNEEGNDFTLSSFVVDCLLYDKLGRLVNNDYHITFGVDNEKEEYVLTKDYLIDKYKGLKQINDNPMIKTVMPYKQLNSFNYIPMRFLRKAEKFLINAIFYLCVDSKKIVKDNNTYKNKEKINNNQKDDNTVTDITYTSCGVIYKNKYLDEKERKNNKECDNNKIGTPKAPHLVRGHFHGYWHGSERLGNKRLEYQYVAPYYTGNGSEIAITVTTIKP